MAPSHQTVSNGASGHKTNYIKIFSGILNLEGHLNLCFGSKVTAEWVDFAFWWSCIGKGLPCSLRSRLVNNKFSNRFPLHIGRRHRWNTWYGRLILRPTPTPTKKILCQKICQVSPPPCRKLLPIYFTIQINENKWGEDLQWGGTLG